MNTAAPDRLLEYLGDINRLPPGFVSLRRGKLKLAESLRFETAGKAMTYFLNFGGEGWLHTSGSRSIHVLDVSLADKDKEALLTDWPIAGERYSREDKVSYHLRQAGDAWIVTAIQIDPNQHAEAVLVTISRLSKDGESELHYEVGFEPVTFESLSVASSDKSFSELRPLKFRFCGFAGVGSGGKRGSP